MPSTLLTGLCPQPKFTYNNLRLVLLDLKQVYPALWLKYEIRPTALCVEWASASGTILGDLGDWLEEVSPGDCAVKAYAWSPVPSSCSATCQSWKEQPLTCFHCCDDDLLTTGPESAGTSSCRLNHLRPWIKINLIFSQVLWSAMQKQQQLQPKDVEVWCKHLIVWSNFPLWKRKEQKSTEN